MPEFAFIGRSNVGKSSLINMLVRQKDLAKTSSTPGKTQMINHFLINENWYLVDLPGYGFAKVSRDTREKWDGLIRTYLVQREAIICVMVLVDLRLEPQKSDIDFLNFLGENGVPLAIIFTKSDKLTKNERASRLAGFKKELLNYWEEMPPFFITSAEEGVGRDEVLAFIHESLTSSLN